MKDFSVSRHGKNLGINLDIEKEEDKRAEWFAKKLVLSKTA